MQQHWFSASKVASFRKPGDTKSRDNGSMFVEHNFLIELWRKEVNLSRLILIRFLRYLVRTAISGSLLIKAESSGEKDSKIKEV